MGILRFWRNQPPQAQAPAVFDLDAAPFARFDKVSLTLEGRTILSEISLELREHRIGIIGMNGSGKSSLVRLLNGLRQPTAGRLTVFGADAAAVQAELPRHVGFVFQNPDHQAIFPTVEEDVAFGLQQLGQGKQPSLEQARAFLAAQGAGHLAARPIADLSEGQKQLCAILAVLIMQPSLLILDEPYSALDGLASRRLHAKLQSLPQKVILISHDRSHLAGFDRVLWIDGGRVRADGPAAEVLDAYDAELARKAEEMGADDWERGHL